MLRKSRKKKARKLKVIWELDNDMPEEERQRRLGKIFEILLSKNS
ncbi:MAG: hypothetical protein WC723_05050 [Candidatus Omnitrophota bacterium]